MENNEITSREELKTYFETSKYPTENQFADLIDSLKHKQDSLTNKELVTLVNSLATLDNGYVQYLINNSGDLSLPIVVSQQNAEDQIIEIDNTYGFEKKQYFFGDPPYNIKAKEFLSEGLKPTEYYTLRYQIGENFAFIRMFGNNLHTISDGFEFGTLEDNRFLLQITKQNFGLKINIINTRIQLINRTEALIQYRTDNNYWNSEYTSKDIITDHYDVSDSFYFYYKADLKAVNQSIECKLYDADNDSLVMTGYLNAGIDNVGIWGGGQATGVRNIRIECDYQQRL